MTSRAAAVCLALSALLSPGLAGYQDDVASRGQPEGPLAVAEVLTAPAIDPQGIVFSVALRNDAEVDVRVSDVVAVPDDGVTVEVLGASTCRNGCAGALPWAEAEPMMERSVEYSDAFRVPPASDVLAGRADAVKVVLHVSASDTAGVRRLDTECLFVRELRVRFSEDGEPVAVRNDHAAFVVSLDRPDSGMPDAQSKCPISDWTG